MKRIAPFVVALCLSLVLGACGGDDDKSSTATTAGDSSASTTAPEDKRAGDADVAKGLRAIEQIAKQISDTAANDQAEAQRLHEMLEPEWEEIEGTVKANDEDTYIAIEDAFALLGDAAGEGDAAKGAKGAADISEAVKNYLAKYPG